MDQPPDVQQDAGPPSRVAGGKVVCAVAFVLLVLLVLFTYYITPMFVIPYYREKPVITRKLFRSVETVLLAYAADHGGALPPDQYLMDFRRTNKNLWRTRTPGMLTFRVQSLTTPVLYIKRDAIADPYALPEQYCPPAWLTLEYEGRRRVVLWSPGPNLVYDVRPWQLRALETHAELLDEVQRRSYDPTNGLKSGGDLLYVFWMD